MGEKIISIARHSIFFKKFFQTHKSILEKLITLNFNTLGDGYNNLLVFYSSYSYWIKDDEDDNSLKDDINYNRDSLLSSAKYIKLIKYSAKGLNTFKYEDLKDLNKLYLENIIVLFKTFETFCKRLAPNDMLPSLTESVTEHDRTIAYVEYDIFFDNFYNIQEEIHKKLLDFTILDFKELFTLTMGFFYGYSYYLQANTQKEIKDKFTELFDIYNDDEFSKLYYNTLQGNISSKGLIKLKDYRKILFEGCLEVFEKINADLPKTNIMPKKQEKVLVDRHSI